MKTAVFIVVMTALLWVISWMILEKNDWGRRQYEYRYYGDHKR